MTWKITLITFKALEDFAPFYIRDLIQLRKQCSYNLRSNNNGRLLETVKVVTKRKSGERARADPEEGFLCRRTPLRQLEISKHHFTG